MLHTALAPPSLLATTVTNRAFRSFNQEVSGGNFVALGLRVDRWIRAWVVRARSEGASRGRSRAPEGSESTWEITLAQAPLLDTANALAETLFAVRPIHPPDKRPAGFSSIEIDADAHQVLLFWRADAEVPPEVSSAVTEQRNSGIDVELKKEAPFSAAELEAATETLLASVKEGSVKEVFATAGPQAHGAGLVLTVTEVTGAVLELVESTNASLSAISALGTGDYVEVQTVSDRLVPLGRWADWPPYWGGSELDFSVGTCSSGFAVGSWLGQYLLTAGHCAPPSFLIPFAFNNRVPIGYAEGLDEEWDTARVVVSSSEGRIFDGSVGTGEFSKPVVGRSGNFVGTMLCTSGALSGARCNIRITNTQQVGLYENGWFVKDMVAAVELAGANAAGGGDSGGPVFSLSSDPSKVRAHGTIASGQRSGATACTGVLNRFCTSSIFFTEIDNVLDHHGVWLDTQ